MDITEIQFKLKNNHKNLIKMNGWELENKFWVFGRFGGEVEIQKGKSQLIF